MITAGIGMITSGIRTNGPGCVTGFMTRLRETREVEIGLLFQQQHADCISKYTSCHNTILVQEVQKKAPLGAF
jgi:hypothetical protein